MIVIRLARGGAKKHPFYHIVVTDSRRRRDSGYLERLGYFNPFAVKDEIPVLLNRDRFDYWISKGAKSSLRVSSIISKLEKGRVEKADVNIIESPKAPATENKPSTKTEATAGAEQPSEKSKPETQTNLELEGKPESMQGEKQAISSMVEAKPEDVGDALNAEIPVGTPASSEANKKTDQE